MFLPYPTRRPSWRPGTRRGPPLPSTRIPEQGHVAPEGLERFNGKTETAARHLLARCLRNPRWALRMAAHRPYPDLASLLAASDEAAYDLSPDELLHAVREECRLLRTDDLALAFLAADDPTATPPAPGAGSGLWSEQQLRVVRSMPRAARTAVRAAWVAYEQKFGHGFVLSLEGVDPEDALNHLLATVRDRLALAPEDERVLAAEELRQLARERLTRLIRSDRAGDFDAGCAEFPPFAPPLGLPV
ncbi:2-oxo-4-hydroxy-4-carboxy-5-ureidoimidazoline decarboxylase [Streptomyces abyssomicinicus]|uniref:2-oxo-4-hydroxy-4-carboxy-5-ureidoimidazoline decarboxylase n=1 Tax=Streptomyces abyssomicinicus TaxID=574929 RepID=UPI0012504C0B|nr:2-oxo-4-hydroxy-4-carboxy-5-ureidoimidazoline decarboxylase [Streptomyces abyssomicinicus]